MNHPGQRGGRATGDLPGSGRKGRIETVGAILVVLGVLVWVVYAILRWGLDQDVTVRQFLLFHLAGVIPGSVLRRWRLIRRLFR